MRLRHLLRERDVRDERGEQVLSVYRDLGVVPKSGRSDNFNKTPEDLSNYKLVLPGEVVVNKMKAWQGSIAVSEYRGIVSGDYLVCEVQREVDRRFLHHALRSPPMIAEYVVRSKGIRPSQWRLYWDDLADIWLDLPSRGQQRAIADYLDAETTRIDAIISKKRDLIELLGERRVATIDSTIDGSGPTVPVRHVIDRLTSGPRGWAEYAADSGTPFIRITNVQRANIELDMSDTQFVQHPRTAEARRTEVRCGDVLVSITADIGSVGVARAQHVGANISQHVALLSPTGCQPDWLAFAVSSSAAQAQLDSGQYGGTKTQLGLGDIRSLRVPVPTPDEQHRLLVGLRSRLGSIAAAAAVLTHQTDLLIEHRQALITAAVTGELAVPGARAA